MFFRNKLKNYSIKPPVTGLAGGLVGVQDSSSIDFSLLPGNILTAQLTLTGVTPGTYGDSTHVAQLTVDSQGRITAISNVLISGGGGSAAWGSIGTGTGVGSQTDLVTYLNANYFPLPGGTVSQYIRGDGSLATFPTIPSITGLVPYIGATTDVDLGTNNITSKKTFITSPVAQVTASTEVLTREGNEVKYKTPAQIVIDGGGSPTPLYNYDAYLASATGQSGVLYLPSQNKLYVCSGSTLVIYSTVTGELLATLSGANFTNAFKVFYIATSDEVWVTSTTLTTIARVSVTGNTFIANITGLSANGFNAINYSATKVFVSVFANPGSIMVINPTTNTLAATITTSVPILSAGMVWNQNPASAQNGKIIICSGGVAILDPTTNTISTALVNPSSAIGTAYAIKYSTTLDKYYVASLSNSRIVVLDIASATTFTLNSIIYNQGGITDIDIDEATDYIISPNFHLGSSTISSITLSLFKLSTLAPVIKLLTPTLCGSASRSGYMALDTTNKRLFLVGAAGSANWISIVKYV